MADYRAPETILNDLGITDPEEIDLEAIAFHCKATVRYRLLDGCAARIIGKGNKAVISVNERSSRRRQRFSIGHELGHWMLDRGKAIYICQKRDLRTKWDFKADPESRANAYAADLLMPAFMFKPAAHGMPMTFASVGELADTFDTSQTATAIRLVQYGSYPAMVVCYGMEGRRWYTPGPDVPYYIRPHKELCHNTGAFELLYGSSGNGGRPILADADDWIDHRDSHKYTIYEHSIKISADAVLTMLWWKDESQLTDLL